MWATTTTAKRGIILENEKNFMIPLEGEESRLSLEL